MTTPSAQLAGALQQAASEHEADTGQARRRRRIVEAARDLFVANGYRKTSLDDVARQAHVAKGTIYASFPTKAALLVAAIAAEKIRASSQILPILDSERPARARLDGWIRLNLTMSRDNPLLHRLMSGDHEIRVVLREMDPALAESGVELNVQFLAGLLDEALAPHAFTPAQLKDRARALLTVVFMASQGLDDPLGAGGGNDTYVELVASLLQRGLTSHWGAAS